MTLKTNTLIYLLLGHLPGKHKIHIDPNVTPVVHPPRRIPISMRDKVRNELNIWFINSPQNVTAHGTNTVLCRSRQM